MSLRKIVPLPPAVQMSWTPPTVNRPAPLVGQHTREILIGMGYSESNVDGFIADGSAGAT